MTDPNAEAWKAAAKILVQARVVIKKKGWEQAPTQGHVCLATAVEAAFRKTNQSVAGFNYACAALKKVLGRSKTSRRVNDKLDVPYWGRELMDWNDRPGRTETDVLKTISTATEYATKRSNQ